MMKEKRLGIILAIALTASLLFTACGPTSVAEEKKVVQIGDIAPLTGATAGPEQINLEGWQDYVTCRLFTRITVSAYTQSKDGFPLTRCPFLRQQQQQL